jgi:hypothetical protein
LGNTTKQTENEIRYCIVEGGDSSDPDPDRAGRVRLRDIQRHGPGVKTTDLPWSQLLSNPQGMGQKEFTRPPDLGQIVVCMVPKGGGTTGYKHVFGIPLGKELAQAAVGGMSFPWQGLEDFKQKTLPINIPPNVEQSTEGSKVIYKIVEKGQKYKRALADNLPSHIASIILAQAPVQELKNVPTALSQVTERLSGALMGAMGGGMFSMSGLLGQISNMSGMPKEIQTGLNNAMTLLQSSNDSATTAEGLNTGFRINEPVFKQNVNRVFANVQTYGDLEQALQTTLTDESIRGLDQLPSTSVVVDGAFGAVTVTIAANGYSNVAQTQQAQAGHSSMSSSLGGILAGSDNLFGQQFQKMIEMAGRMPTTQDWQTKIQQIKKLGNEVAAREKQNNGGSQTTRDTSLQNIFKTGSLSTTLDHVTQWSGNPIS